MANLPINFDHVPQARAWMLYQLKQWRRMVEDTEEQIRVYQSFKAGIAFTKDLRSDVVRSYQQAKRQAPETHQGRRLRRLDLDILLTLSNRLVSVPKRDLVYDDLVSFKDQLLEAQRVVEDFSTK